METKATLIRSDGTVELHTIAYVNMNITLVIGPRHTEHDYTLRFYETLNKLCFFKFRMLIINIFDRIKYFFNCLKEFRLARMLLRSEEHTSELQLRQYLVC